VAFFSALDSDGGAIHDTGVKGRKLISEIIKAIDKK
jgi:hypothetical protein